MVPISKDIALRNYFARRLEREDSSFCRKLSVGSVRRLQQEAMQRLGTPIFETMSSVDDGNFDKTKLKTIRKDKQDLFPADMRLHFSPEGGQGGTYGAHKFVKRWSVQEMVSAAELISPERS